MKKLIFIFASIVLFAQILRAQDNADITSPNDSLEAETYSHGVIAKVEKGKIILRWAPTSFVLWDMGNTYGYNVEKIAFDFNPYLEHDKLSDNGEDYQFKLLNNMPLKPWTIEQFQARIKDESDLYLGVAMEMLYGDLEETKDPTKGSSLQHGMMEQESRHAFALLSADFDKEAANSLALRYEDTDVKAGEFYLYRITINHYDPDIKTDTIELLIDMAEITPDMPVRNCMVEPYDGEIKISWTRHNDVFFSAYDIERSTDKVNWEKLNKQPFMGSSFVSGAGHIYIDTSIVNKKTYYYRLRGYTPFGEKGLYSEVMSTAGKDLTPPAPVFNVKAEDQGGVVKISWEAEPNESDFDGFYVGRSYIASGGFEKISEKLPKTARAFVDFMPNPLESNYYTVISVDKDGNEVQSYVALGYIIDSIPPAAPVGLKGEIDTTGIVTISWNRGPEADIIGYRVYWANDTLAEFSQLSGDVHAHTVYRDSVNLKTLTKYVYYKVTAVDHRYNHSEYSGVLALKRPDIVPPAPPVISSYEQGQLSVNFKWINSISDDVVKHWLERKISDQGEWEEIASFTKEEDQWVDSALTKGEFYAYRVAAVDDAGNESFSKPLEITALDRGEREHVKNLRITTKDNDNFLEWSYGKNGDFFFVLYKKQVEETVFEPFAKVSSSDKDFQINEMDVEYGVRVLFPDGGESKLVTLKP